MSYQITITSSIPNPNYDKELAEWKAQIGSDMYGNKRWPDQQLPSRFIENKALTCDLTDEEYKRFKVAALKEAI